MFGPWHCPDPDAGGDERDEIEEAFVEWLEREADFQHEFERLA